MTDHLPSKDVPLPTLMAWLRDRHAAEAAAGNEWSYEGLIHAHIEHLQRELAREVGTRAARVAEIDHLRRRVAELERDVGLAVWAAGAKPARRVLGQEARTYNPCAAGNHAWSGPFCIICQEKREWCMECDNSRVVLVDGHEQACPDCCCWDCGVAPGEAHYSACEARAAQPPGDGQS